MLENQPKGENEANKNTFTKSYMSIIMVIYFIGAVVGTVLVIVASMIDIRLGMPVSTAMYVAYGTYIAAPTAIAVGFYAWKSKAENLLKIKNSYDKASEIDFKELMNMIANLERG